MSPRRVPCLPAVHEYAGVPATTRGQFTHIKTDDKNARIIYCLNNSIVSRSLENPMDSWSYNDHPAATSCAAKSPKGDYIASGDARGTVRVWSKNADGEVIIKYEGVPFGGKVNDKTEMS